MQYLIIIILMLCAHFGCLSKSLWAFESNRDSVAVQGTATEIDTSLKSANFSYDEIESIKKDGFHGLSHEVLKDWVTAGFNKQDISILSSVSLETAVAWKKEGCDATNTLKWVYDKRNISDSGNWCKYGFVPEEAVKWDNFSFTPIEAAGWVQLTNFSAEEAEKWKKVGVDKKIAKTWKDADKSPEDAKEWKPFSYDYVMEVQKQCPSGKPELYFHNKSNPYDNNGKCYHFIGNALQLLGKSEGLFNTNTSSIRFTEIAHIAFGDNVAPVFYEGFVKENSAYEYIDVSGAKRIINSFKAIQVNDKALQNNSEIDKPLKLDKNEITKLTKMKININLASKWRSGKCGVKEIISWLQPKTKIKSSKVIKNNTNNKIYEDEIEDGIQWCKYGFSHDEALDWSQSRFDAKEAFEWKNEGIKKEEARIWRAAGKTPEQAKKENINSVGEIDPVKVQCPKGIKDIFRLVYDNPYNIKNVCYEIVGDVFQLLGRNEGLYTLTMGSAYPVYVNFGDSAASNSLFHGIVMGQAAYEYIEVSGAKKAVHAFTVVKQLQ